MRPETLRILGIAGSLRLGSHNRALLRVAIELAPEELSITPFERLGQIPLYDADLEAREIPEPVAALKTAMAAADGILIATPEYNHSLPGVLKNALDWVSRPAGKAAFAGKPVAIMGATPGNGATIRGQLALRQVLDPESFLMASPEVLIARAGERFDAAGRLTDERTRQFVARFLAAFAGWIARVRV